MSLSVLQPEKCKDASDHDKIDGIILEIETKQINNYSEHLDEYNKLNEELYEAKFKIEEQAYYLEKANSKIIMVNSKLTMLSDELYASKIYIEQLERSLKDREE